MQIITIHSIGKHKNGCSLIFSLIIKHLCQTESVTKPKNINTKLILPSARVCGGEGGH